MDQKRLFVAILISLMILLGYQFVATRYLPHPPVPVQPVTHATVTPTTPSGPPAATAAAPAVVHKAAPRIAIAIAAPSVGGSINLRGARIDDLVLTQYRVTEAPNAPDVRLLAPETTKQPYYVQYGWSAAPGEHVALPGTDTVWTASAPSLSPSHPVTLSWDNGAGLVFRILLTIDNRYMFGVTQSVRNTGKTPVKLFPWMRVRRDYTPPPSSYYLSFKGLTGVAHARLQEMGYPKAKSNAKNKPGNVAYEATSNAGWAGITDKYWLAALIPAQGIATTLHYRYIPGGDGHYQVDYVPAAPETITPDGSASMATHLFAGAKVVELLDHYEAKYNIPHFDKAVDFGWFYFLTKPVFFALDYLNDLLGNFGLAIMAFTIGVKLLFFPLANYSYRSMSKMRLLGPKIKAMRELYKDDPQKQQKEMMLLYKAEKVNPASGCLPMLVQVPVFFALYKVLYVTIEMRQAPFFGWIHDLSQMDPTNVFTLFGLIPWDPTAISPFLHVGAWPLFMGLTMWAQQKLNPTPPDPMQAKLFLFMPIIFTFMLTRFPAGLIIYYSCSNLLSVAQQWVIMRRTRLTRPGLART
ncbi:MAG: membrane protein insertase YidC [Acetobacteraceae bacterium]